MNDDILRTIYESDIVIDMLGDAFSYDIGEFGGNISSIAHSLDILLATSLGKDVVLFPQSIGPFRNKLVKLLAKFSLNRAKVIVVREELSKNYLEDIGVNKPEIYLTADTAFILEPASDKRVYEMLSKGGLENDNTPLIGINISQLLNYKSKNLAIKEDYIALMAKLADYLVENLNVNIIFVPHEITPYKTTTEIENRIALIGGDDINAVKEAYEKVKNKEKVIPIVDRDVLLLN
ncbi:polysaccharide pyruvyl transferase family protein [Candidatus Bipolaricaulota bacterium]|nr:polysaccharide pyruvyl transferase family protein [Candidatus Bipolaricaulota bacterium]